MAGVTQLLGAIVSPIRVENRDRYPADWRQISDGVRFGRAQRRCECDGRCGRGHEGRCEAVHGGMTAAGKPVILTVAHLDHTPENCDPRNLMAACQACHLAYDAEHHAATRRATIAAELAAQMEPLFSDDPACSVKEGLR